MKDENGRLWLPVTRLSAHCDISRRTVYNWLAAGKLETRKTVSGKTVIAVDSVFVSEETRTRQQGMRAGAQLRQQRQDLRP